MRAIVIGAGPSLDKFKHLEQLAKSKFEGMIYCTDAALKQTLEAGVLPKKFKNLKIVTCETSEGIMKFFDYDICKKYATQLSVISYVNGDAMVEWVRLNGYTVLNEPMNLETMAFSNSGGIAWLQAIKDGASEVVLIGMDHSLPLSFLDNFPKEIQDFFFIKTPNYCLDLDYQYYTRTFFELAKIKNVKTINCTGQGALYSESITKGNFADYVN